MKIVTMTLRVIMVAVALSELILDLRPCYEQASLYIISNAFEQIHIIEALPVFESHTCKG